MIIFLYGQDNYRSQEKLFDLINKFKEKRDLQGTSITELDGESLSNDEFRKNVLSAGLFAKKRMIIIKNLLAENKDQELLEEIMKFLKNKNNEDNVVIFYEIASPLKNKLNKKVFDLLAKEKYAEQFEALDERNLNKWIHALVQKEKGQISDSAVSLLIDFFGNNLWSIKNEIDKALAYGQGKITPEILKLLGESEKEENIFALMDALVAKNKKRAVELLEKELAKGTFFPQIIGSLAYQFRIMLQVKDSNNSNFYQLAKELGAHPFSIKKAVVQVKKYSLDELKKIYQEILEIDLQLKTSSRDPELLFDLLIAKL
jgi:DNA polymerase III subunit delta